MKLPAAINRLRPDFVQRDRDRAVYKAVQDDLTTYIGRLPRDIRKYMLRPLFAELRRQFTLADDTRTPAARRLLNDIIVTHGQHVRASTMLVEDFRALFGDPVSSQVLIKHYAPNRVAVATDTTLQFYEFRERCHLLRTVRHTSRLKNIHYIGGNVFLIYQDGWKHVLDDGSIFATGVAGSITSVTLLPCGLMLFNNGAMSKLHDQYNHHENVGYTRGISDDFGNEQYVDMTTVDCLLSPICGRLCPVTVV